MSRTTTRVTAFDPNSPISPLADWELQTGDNESETSQEAYSLKSDGDRLRGTRFDRRKSVTMEYDAKSKAAGTAYAIPTVGSRSKPSVSDDTWVHIDSFSLRYAQNAIPRLTIAGHYHLDGLAAVAGNDKGHDKCRMYTKSIEPLAMDIGVPDTFGTLEDPDAVFALTDDAGVDIRSATYSMQVNHIDEPNRTGGHLRGENHDATETLEIEFTGLAILGTDYTVGSGWEVDDKGRSRSNTAFSASRVKLVHHVAHDVEQSASLQSASPPASGDDGETQDGETLDGETQDGETQDGETQDGETQDGETQDGETQGDDGTR